MLRKLLLFLFLSCLLTAGTVGQKPDNVTLELRAPADRIFIDGAEVGNSDFYQDNSLDYGYISSGQPIGIIGLSNPLIAEYQNNSKDLFKITQSGGQFLVPFTRGGENSILRREEDLNQNDFLNLLEPSFGFPIPTQRRIRVTYRFQHPITSFRGDSSSIDSLAIQNKLNNKDQTELIIKSD